MVSKTENLSSSDPWLTCTRFLGGHGMRPVRETLTTLVASVQESDEPDHYGSGAVVQAFEARIAEVLGKESALFFPTGTMTQQIALRQWCERAARPVVAFHPTCHLEIHEQHAYQVMHGLRPQLVGEGDRVITLDDLQGVGEKPAALLLELPQREIGGQLPAWEDLQAQLQWAHDQGIRTHMDGARLWESQPYYGRTYAEIASGFDSVYVSFYKGLGALGGAALAGPEDFVAEARVWLRRHGGNLFQFYPYVLSARAALDERLGRFGAYRDRAVAIARLLCSIPGVRVKPEPPQTNMMHVYLSGNRERMVEAAREIACRDGVALFRMLRPTDVPGESMWELSIGEGAFELSDDEIGTYMAQITQAGRDQTG